VVALGIALKDMGSVERVRTRDGRLWSLNESGRRAAACNDPSLTGGVVVGDGSVTGL